MKSENKKLIIGIFVVAVIFVAIVCLLIPLIKKAKLNAKIEAEIQALRETPAAEYCENNGGNLEIKGNELDGVYGMCNFDDGSVCEVTEYFKGECSSASEQDENESLYCSEGSVCEDEENLSNRIDNINDIEDVNGEPSEEFLNSDDLDEMDIDSLYDYYESEFTNSGQENRNKSMGKLKGGENVEDQLSSACEGVGGTILGDRCYLSNGLEIVF